MEPSESVQENGRAVFLDRDGVINEVVFRDGKLASPRTYAEFRFCNRIHSAISRLSEAGLRLFVVSNQPDVARGLLSATVLEEMSRRILTELPVEKVITCPHDDAHGCWCRKPKPGMLLDVASSFSVDLSRSFIIGDTWRDVLAGRNAGCKTVLLRRDYNHKVAADITVEELSQAVDVILTEMTHDR